MVTGSSALDIENIAGEPLTGRKKTFHLYSFSEQEFSQVENNIERVENLKQRLVYGNYPELIHSNSIGDRQVYLSKIVKSYLLKDIMMFDNIKRSNKIVNLLRLISYQVGELVSYQELGQQLGMSKNTVESYLDLLSKVFIVFKIESYSRNLRNEIKNSHKWYFYDKGIRNSVIANLKF